MNISVENCYQYVSCFEIKYTYINIKMLVYNKFYILKRYEKTQQKITTNKRKKQRKKMKTIKTKEDFSG